jgi:hypothetical protein
LQELTQKLGQNIFSITFLFSRDYKDWDDFACGRFFQSEHYAEFLLQISKISIQKFASN